MDTSPVCIPTTPPETSRLLTKRRCPFGSPPQRRLCTEQRMIRNCASGSGVTQSQGSAFYKLMQSDNRYGRTDEPVFYNCSTAIMSSKSTCFVCQTSAEETIPCSFCEHGICEMCIRQCERCFGVFCSFCSTLNYEQKKDRAFCLSCHVEERKKTAIQRRRISVGNEALLQTSHGLPLGNLSQLMV